MIYCVRDEDVVAHLASVGFHLIGRSPEGRAFLRGKQRLSIRAPNQDGHLPEILVNDAFDVAGLTPPAWEVFWCD